jgi:hypothetical protein
MGWKGYFSFKEFVITCNNHLIPFCLSKDLSVLKDIILTFIMSLCLSLCYDFVCREVTILLRGGALLLVMERKGSIVLSLIVPLHHLPNKGLVNVVLEVQSFIQ